MIEAIRNFIDQYEELEKKALLNVEYLPSGPTNSSIMEEALADIGKGVGVVSRYGNGMMIKEFRVRLLRNAYYEEPVETNIANSNFMKDFEAWIRTCNKNENYPNIDGILSIETTTNGYIQSVANDQTHAVYSVGLRVTYLTKE